MVVQSLLDGFHIHFNIPHTQTFRHLERVARKNGFHVQRPSRLFSTPKLVGGSLVGDMASFIGLLFLFVSYILNAKNKRDGSTKLLLLEDREIQDRQPLLFEDQDKKPLLLRDQDKQPLFLQDRELIRDNEASVTNKEPLLLEDRELLLLEDIQTNSDSEQENEKILEELVKSTIREVNQVAQRVLPLNPQPSKNQIKLRPLEGKIEEEIVKEASIVGGPNRVRLRAAQIEAQLRIQRELEREQEKRQKTNNYK